MAGPTVPFRRLVYSSSGGGAQSSSSSTTSLTAYCSLLFNWTKDWLRVMYSHWAASLSEGYGLHCPLRRDCPFRHCRTGGRQQQRRRRRRLLSPLPPLAHFRSFSGRTRRLLALLDQLFELFIALSTPTEAVFVGASLARFAWQANRQFGQAWLDSSSSSSISSSLADEATSATSASPMQLPQCVSAAVFKQLQLLADLIALFLVLQYIHRRLCLFYKVVLLVSVAWCLHARQLLQSAVRGMRAAEQRCYYLLLLQCKSGLGPLFSVSLTTVKKQHAHHTSGYASLCSPPQQSRLLAATIDRVWVRTFIVEQCRLLVDLVHLDRHFASPLLFAFYAPILTASVYVLCLLYFLPGEGLLQLKLYLLVVYLALLYSSVLLVALSTVVRFLYDPAADRQLFRAQMLVKRGGSGCFLRTKLKLMSYYEVLRTEKKVTFTFGLHAKVESTWLWEVLSSIPECFPK